MARLSESGYRRALDVLHEAGDVAGPIPFPEPVLHALQRLVPSDVVAYHEQIGSASVVVWVGEPRGPMTPQVQEASRRHALNVLKPTVGARLYSDYMSIREYHKTALYQELGRPLGVEDMVRLWLDPHGDGRARLEFDRPDRGFRESDRFALDLLLPHLKQFRRNAIARRRSLTWQANGAAPLSAREREILELVAQGLTNAQIARMLWISPETVRKHLENVYAKLDVHTRTGAVAAVFGFGGRATSAGLDR